MTFPSETKNAIQALINLLENLAKSGGVTKKEVEGLVNYLRQFTVAEQSARDINELTLQLNNLSKAMAQIASQGAGGGMLGRLKDVTEQFHHLKQNILDAQRVINKDAVAAMFDVPGAPKAPAEYNPKGDGGGKPKFSQQEYWDSLKNGTVAAKNFYAELDKLKLQGAEIKNSFVEASTGVNSIYVELEKAGGVTRRATVRMDQFGNVIQDTSKRFLSFSQTIARDLRKFLEWTIAGGIVVGVMNLFNRTFDEIIDTEKELIDIQTQLSLSTQQLATIFDTAGKIADATGSDINGVIDGYKLAYAATGDIANEAQRAAATQLLLRNSMILSELAAIDQANALDILVGGISQTGDAVEETTRYLDSWVAVSRQANVSVDTLSSAFAIVGTAAQDAGVTLDELNAIAAVLAQSTKLSADETGNAIRGFVAGFQTDTAVAVLDKYGISVRNFTDDLRGFIEITDEVVKLQQQGLIDERGISEIANAIGGGFRRGAQVATFIENYADFQRLVAVSQNASGEATELLAQRLESLDTSLQKLANSFTKLSKALGVEGGFIGILKFGADTLTTIVNLLTEVTEQAGAAVPVLAALGAAMMIGSNQRFAGRFAGWQEGIENWAGNQRGKALETGNFGWRYRTANWLYPGAQAYGGIPPSQNQMGPAHALSSRMGLQYSLTSYLPVAAQMATSFAQGLQEENMTEFGGSVAGAIIGGLLTGGNPVGVLIGSIAGETLLGKITELEGDFTARWAEIFQAAQEQAEADSKPPDPDVERTISELEQEAKNAIPGWITALAVVAAGAMNTSGATRSFFGASDPRDVIPGEGGIDPKDLITYWANTNDSLFPEDATALIKRLQIEQNREAEDATAKVPTTETDRRIKQRVERIDSDIDAFVEQYKAGKLSELQYGEISRQQFSKDVERYSGNFTLVVARIQEALDQAGIDAKLEDILTIFNEITGEESAYFTRLANDAINTANTIDLLIEKLNDPAITDAEKKEFGQGLTEARERQSFLQGQLEEYYDTTTKSVSFRRVDQLPVIDLTHLTEAQANQVLEAAQKEYEAYLDATAMAVDGLKITDEMKQDIIAHNRQQLVEIMSGFMEGTTGIPQNFISDQLEELGLDKSATDSSSNFGLLDLRGRLGSGGMSELLDIYGRIVTAVGQNFPDYEYDMSDVGVISEEGFDTLHVDMNLLNLALQELIDVNEDQLQGIYNLPEGATFYVPVTAYDLSKATRAGMGGRGVNPDSEFLDYEPSEVPEDRMKNNARLLGESVADGLMRSEYQRRAQNFEKIQNQYMPSFRDLIEQQAAPRWHNPSLQELMRRFPSITVPEGYNPAGLSAETQVDVKPLALNLNIESTSTVQLDGRTIGTIVKQFLYNELIRNEGSGGAASRRFVI